MLRNEYAVERTDVTITTSPSYTVDAQKSGTKEFQPRPGDVWRHATEDDGVVPLIHCAP